MRKQKTKNTTKNKIRNKQDKVFKNLFYNVKEAVHIINWVLGISLMFWEIERVTNSFITSNYKYKEADCVYKIKGENIYFVLEHQSVIDYRMPYRMSNYQIEVMRSWESYKNTKDNKEALVIGIVFIQEEKNGMLNCILEIYNIN